MQVQGKQKGSFSVSNFGIGKLMPGSKNEVEGKTVKPVSQNGGMRKQKVRGDGIGRQMQREGGSRVVAEGRKSVSQVESNVASVAAFLHVKVVSSDMPDFMKVHAFRCARRTHDSLEKFSSKHLAYNMKKDSAEKLGFHILSHSSSTQGLLFILLVHTTAQKDCVRGEMVSIFSMDKWKDEVAGLCDVVLSLPNKAADVSPPSKIYKDH